MKKSVLKTGIKFLSLVALAAMTIAGVGASIDKPAEGQQLACHNPDHNCVPTCGVRG